KSGRFIYMSQIAVDPDHRGRGLAAALQEYVLARYKKLPLVAHVAVFTQPDFDAWSGDKKNFDPRSNNAVSHRYHQKNGYVVIALAIREVSGSFNRSRWRTVIRRTGERRKSSLRLLSLSHVSTMTRSITIKCDPARQASTASE